MGFTNSIYMISIPFTADLFILSANISIFYLEFPSWTCLFCIMFVYRFYSKFHSSTHVTDAFTLQRSNHLSGYVIA